MSPEKNPGNRKKTYVYQGKRPINLRFPEMLRVKLNTFIYFYYLFLKNYTSDHSKLITAPVKLLPTKRLILLENYVKASTNLEAPNSLIFAKLDHFVPKNL
jgi:hypothetical protein